MTSGLSVMNGKTVSESCSAGYLAYCMNGSEYCMFICFSADTGYLATLLRGIQVCYATASGQNAVGLSH